MPTRRQLIQKITLNANSNSITFSNIPQNYTDLKIVASARTDRPTEIVDVLNIGFNGSTSNFSNRWLDATGSGARSGSNLGTSGRGFWYTPCGGATSNTFSNNELYIPNYSGSNNKSYHAKSMQETNGSTAYMISVAGLWSSATNISSIEISILYGTNFAANSTFYLYGITHVPIIRGGEVTVPGDGFKYHTFRSSGSLQVIEPGDVQLAVQGGGGAGSGGISGVNYGAAGAGGNNYSGRARLTQGVMTVSVGAGGAGAANVDGTSGTASSIGSIISMSGGGFGQVNGDYGGSNAIYSGGYNNGYFGGGGAGAGASASGSNPGAGVLNFDGIRRGGGGGANASHEGITYGVDGGGTGWGGSYTGTNRPSPNGESTRGGGGAGTLGSYNPNGGSGIVIIRYPYDGN